MERKPVNSSHISSVGFDAPSGTLHIEFKNGTVYEYAGVVEHQYQALIDAKSNGEAFHTHIKDHFKARKIQ